MKKVESVNQRMKTNWKAKVFWSQAYVGSDDPSTQLRLTHRDTVMNRCQGPRRRGKLTELDQCSCWRVGQRFCSSGQATCGRRKGSRPGWSSSASAAMRQRSAAAGRAGAGRSATRGRGSRGGPRRRSRRSRKTRLPPRTRPPRRPAREEATNEEGPDKGRRGRRWREEEEKIILPRRGRLRGRGRRVRRGRRHRRVRRRGRRRGRGRDGACALQQRK